MENYRPPLEKENDPDKTGTVEGSKKKKKKTTRIPKSSGILPKLEAEEAKTVEKDKEDKDKPNGVLENLLAKETDKDKSIADDEEAETATTEEDQEVIPDQPFEVLEEEPVDLPDSLEGEFAEEGTIIARAESPQTDAKELEDENTAEPEKAAARPVKSSGGGFEPPEPPIDTPKNSEVPSPEVPTPVAEAISHEVAMPTPHLERPMFDPSVHYERSVTPEKMHTETEPTIPLSEHEQEVYYARKRATSRGVLAGGVFGYWLGRRGRKAAEKEAAVAHETVAKQNKKLERLEAEQAMAIERFKNIEESKTELINHTQKAELPKVAVEPINTFETAPVLVSKETAPAFDKQPVINEKQSPQPELALVGQQKSDETYQVPEGRRVETSAWHRYEVDEKTGKVVENPELAYGEEFQKEQRQEKLQRPATEPHVAVQLGAAVVQNTSADDVAQSIATDGTQPKAEAKKSGITLLKDKTYIKNQFVRRTTDPVTWVIALGLVVLLFLAGIL